LSSAVTAAHLYLTGNLLRPLLQRNASVRPSTQESLASSIANQLPSSYAFCLTRASSNSSRDLVSGPRTKASLPTWGTGSCHSPVVAPRDQLWQGPCTASLPTETSMSRCAQTSSLETTPATKSPNTESS